MRLVNRFASLLLAFALLGGGLLLAAEAVTVSLDRPSLLIDRAGWFRTLTGTPLNDPVVRAVAIGVTALGLLILLAQLRRWAPDRLALPSAENWHLQRRSVERRLAGTADGVPGVRSATARIRRRGDSWRPRIRAVADPAVRPAVERAVREELERLSAPETGAIDVELIQERGVQ
jgi:hypothetical protein